MTWPDQTPPATDVILHVNVPCAGAGPDKLTYLEIVGTLFEHQEICRLDLEALIRQANAMAGCRSFQNVVDAFRAMRKLDGRSGPQGAG